MNVKLLHQIIEIITAKPHLFQMDEVFKQKENGEIAASIYGWALLLDGYTYEDYQEFIQTGDFTGTPPEILLDLPAPTWTNNILYSLIMPAYWPEPFRSRFNATEEHDYLTQAQVASWRIVSFIEEHRRK